MAFRRPPVASGCLLALYGPLWRSEGVLQRIASPACPFLSKFIACHRHFWRAILTPHPAPFPFFLFFLVFGIDRYLILFGKSS